MILGILFAVGMTFGQHTSSEWTAGNITYSTGGDSLITGVTISSYAVQIPKAMTLREDLNRSLTETDTRSATAYKMPSSLSFQWTATETLTNSDSINVIKKIQFSADSTTWTTAVNLDTLISLTTDTSATVSLYEVMTTFPDLMYFRIQSTHASAAGDTVTVVDKWSRKFTQ